MPDKGCPSKEYELISRIQARLPNARRLSPPPPYEVMIGDDAAVRLNSTAGERLIITADISVENVHFSPKFMTFEEIGYKAMAANLSDCAAMGASPDSAVVQIVFPKNRPAGESIEEIYAGFATACEKWNFPIVGGDLSGGAVWTIGITLIGAVPPGGRILMRTGVKDGDALWVTGTPGKSAAGLAAMRKWRREKIPKQYRRFVNAHIAPTPRISEGKALAAARQVHAMMDLSDGLSKDVATLCCDNNLGFIFYSGIMPPPEMINLSDELGCKWQDWFYHGGEEYELIFACEPEFDPRGIIKNGGDDVDNAILTKLGYFTSKVAGVTREGGGEALEAGGWDHLK